jgi:hypothetical protein
VLQLEGAHVRLVVAQGSGVLGERPFLLGHHQHTVVSAQVRDDVGGDLVDHAEHIVDRAVVPPSPKMSPVRTIDELGGDPCAVAGPPDAPFQHVPHAELGRDRGHVHVRALVDEGRVAGDHEQVPTSGEPRDQVFDEPVGERSSIGIARDFEREHGDRRPIRLRLGVWWRELGCQAGGRRLIEPHGAGEPAEVVLPEISEARPVLDIAGGQEDLAPVPGSLDPSRPSRGGSQVVTAVRVRGPAVDAHPRREIAYRLVPLLRYQTLLRLDRRLQGIGRIGESRHESVACVLDDDAGVRVDHLLEDLVVPAERRLHGAARPVPPGGTADDVREQERHHAARKRHRTSPIVAPEGVHTAGREGGPGTCDFLAALGQRAKRAGGRSIDGVDGQREPERMAFTVAARSYERYMGRYSTELAPKLVSFAGIERGMRVLDVGCGPGALTAALADRSGADNIAAVDPSEPLLAACAERIPGVDARVAHAERLPWPDGSFDAVASQLVLNFMKDPEAGVREMHRSPGRRASSPRAHGTTPTACSSFASSGTRLSSSIRQRRTRAG